MSKCILVFLIAVAGCTAPGIKPVEIYPEDMCSNCKMAFSEHRFVAEIIGEQGDVFKFDDIECMLRFRSSHNGLKIQETYLTDYDTREWISYAQSTIVGTNLDTPMGSGKVAFANASRAKEFQQLHPPGTR